eukprot:jgi/Mesvir1/28911/Mv17998-RA.1
MAANPRKLFLLSSILGIGSGFLLILQPEALLDSLVQGSINAHSLGALSLARDVVRKVGVLLIGEGLLAWAARSFDVEAMAAVSNIFCLRATLTGAVALYNQVYTDNWGTSNYTDVIMSFAFAIMYSYFGRQLSTQSKISGMKARIAALEAQLEAAGGGPAQSGKKKNI